MEPDSRKKLRVIGVILARGGSTGIKLKNIKLLAGRPLLYWSLHALRDSGVVDEVWVSTDHDDIERIALEGGARVHRRSPEVSLDTTSSLESLVEFMDVHKPQCDVVIHVQATTPCIQPIHFKELMKKYEDYNYDSIVTVVRLHLFRWQEVPDGVNTFALTHHPDEKPRRQDWNGELFENGAAYVTRAHMLQRGVRLGGKVGYYEMPERLFVDIDTYDDWPIAEDRVRRYGYNPDEQDGENDQIKVLICHANGTHVP